MPTERVYARSGELAGISVADAVVLTLAGLLRDGGFDETAKRLENAYDAEVKVLALTICERDELLRSLEDAPDGLAELRGVLVRDREWRVEHGLV